MNLNISTNALLVSNYYPLWMAIALCFSAFVSYKAYPIIIKISKLKGLMQEPGNRSSHVVETPNLGGIGIFLGIICTLTFIGSILSYNNLLCLIGASTFIFFTGLKDDLVEISPLNKLMGQIIASLCIIIISDVRIYSFFGIFGIHTLPYIISVIFTLFVFILLINAFNLIDGVDGLAASIAITSSIIFGTLFYINGNHSMLFISLSLIGALSTFLIFNFSKSQKLFMGDTGSMIVGFFMTYQGISFLGMNNSIEMFSSMANTPILVIAIFSFPLMDTCRVFTIRLMQKRSPFSADKNHIHHNLLSLGFKHWEISIIASVFVLVMAVIAYTFNTVNLHAALFYLVTVVFLFSMIPSVILELQKNKRKHKILKHNFFKVLRHSNKKPSPTFRFQKIYHSILNIFISIIILLKLY